MNAAVNYRGQRLFCRVTNMMKKQSSSNVAVAKCKYKGSQ